MSNLKKKIAVFVSVLMLFSFIAACGSKTPGGSNEPSDVRRPIIDMSRLVSTVYTDESTVLDISAEDNISTVAELKWDWKVEFDGDDVTDDVFNKGNRTFTPRVVGSYRFMATVTDKAGNYMTRTFDIFAELDVWAKKDYTFTTAAPTAETQNDFALFEVGVNGIELKRGYEAIALDRFGIENRKFTIVEDNVAKTPVELSGSFFIEFKWRNIDSDQNMVNSRMALEFVRKDSGATPIVDEISIINNSSIYEYSSNFGGSASGTGVFVAHPLTDAEKNSYHTLKVGRFVDDVSKTATYVYYHNNEPRAVQSVGGNYGEKVSLNLFTFRSMGDLTDLKMGEFSDIFAPTLSVNSNFPETATNDEKIDIGRIKINDNIVPTQFNNVIYNVTDKDGQPVEVGFNRTFRAKNVGAHTVKIKVADLSGNTSEEITRTITVSDTNAPKITFTGAVTGAITGVDSVIQCQVADAFAGAVTVTERVLKAGAVTTDATVRKGTNGEYIFKANVAGDYQLEITAKDASNNQGVMQHGILVVAQDTEAPTIEIDNPGTTQSQMTTLMYFVATDNISTTDHITVTSRMVKGGVIAPNGSVSGGTLLSDVGTPNGTEINLVNSRRLRWLNNWYNPETREFTTHSRTGTESAGEYFLEVTATDEAGNVAIKSQSITVENMQDVYDIASPLAWGWETFHTKDKLSGVILGKDSVMIPARAGTTEGPNFVPYVRKYFPIGDVMNGDFDYEMFYEDIKEGTSTEATTVRLMLYYAADAGNTMGRRQDTVAFGAGASQQWLEINIYGNASWTNGPQKIKMSGRNYFKVERRIFNGAAYYRYFIGSEGVTDAERVANAVCLNPAGQNVGTAYAQYLVGFNFFGHKAGGNFTDIKITQR